MHRLTNCIVGLPLLQKVLRSTNDRFVLQPLQNSLNSLLPIGMAADLAQMSICILKLAC
ncbi:hypothetical protein O77CONTIG1_03294 [Leptolyngbya sp. O-77]|nr:hypothetical protein O77CONTIG1_03294 [Leptolyngbya sp. O-77]